MPTKEQIEKLAEIHNKKIKRVESKKREDLAAIERVRSERVRRSRIK